MVIPLTSISAAATTTISSACLTCGAIKKSGKLSCCARGGSWFGNCGATGNTKFQYSWYEGIQACKARQPKTVMGQQLNSVQQNSNNSSHDNSDIMNSKTAIVIAHMSVSKSAGRPISGTTLSPMRANAPIKVSTVATSNLTTRDTSGSNTVSVRTSVNYSTYMTRSKVISTTTTRVTHTFANVSTRMFAIPPANPPITVLANGPITHPVNSILTNPGHVSATESSMDITPFHTSDSVPITTRECEKFLSLSVPISILLMITISRT